MRFFEVRNSSYVHAWFMSCVRHSSEPDFTSCVNYFLFLSSLCTYIVGPGYLNLCGGVQIYGEGPLWGFQGGWRASERTESIGGLGKRMVSARGSLGRWKIYRAPSFLSLCRSLCGGKTGGSKPVGKSPKPTVGRVTRLEIWFSNQGCVPRKTR